MCWPDKSLISGVPALAAAGDAAAFHQNRRWPLDAALVAARIARMKDLS